MAHSPQVLTIEAGTSKTFPLILLADDGTTVINPTGATSIQALFKRNLTDPDSAAAVTKTLAGSGITVTNAATGQISVGFVPADTAGVTAPTTYQFAVKVVFSSTNEVIGALGTLAVQPVAVASV